MRIERVTSPTESHRRRCWVCPGKWNAAIPSRMGTSIARLAIEMRAGGSRVPVGIVGDADGDVEGLALGHDEVIRQRIDGDKGVALDVRDGAEPAEQGVPAGFRGDGENSGNECGRGR